MFIGVLIAFVITVLIVSIVVGSWKDEHLAVSITLIIFLIITLFIIFKALFII